MARKQCDLKASQTKALNLLLQPNPSSHGSWVDFIPSSSIPPSDLGCWDFFCILVSLISCYQIYQHLRLCIFTECLIVFVCYRFSRKAMGRSSSRHGPCTVVIKLGESYLGSFTHLNAQPFAPMVNLCCRDVVHRP